MGELTGRQRLLRVFNQQPGIDRVPVSPFIHVNYVKEYYGSQEVDCAEKTPEVYRHFGFDLIHRNCTPVYDAYGPQGPNWQIEVSRAIEGRNETTTTSIHTPDGDLRYVEALRWVYEYDAESAPIEYPIKHKADLDRLIRYQPPPGPVDVSDIRKAQAAVGEDGVIAPWIQGAFNLVAFYYRELSALVLDAMIAPRFYDRMMQHMLGRYKAHVQQLIDAGVDILSYGGNIANAKLIGPDFYQEHIWPYEKAFIEFIQGQGVIVLYHNCGYARKLLPLYPGLGMKAYESLTPPPYGDTILAEAIEILGPSTTLSGNIDQLDLLRKGSAEDIDAAVKHVLDTVRGKAHFILATTDYFNENTPHDSIHVLAEAGHRYGKL